jgi:hypothetical protein
LLKTISKTLTKKTTRVYPNKSLDVKYTCKMLAAASEASRRVLDEALGLFPPLLASTGSKYA